jgi:hypothetical protein
MPSEKTLLSARSDLAKMVGYRLCEIRICVFYVDFVFYDEISIIVRVKKEFGFIVHAEKREVFDPAQAHHNPAYENSGFVFLAGLRCTRVVLEADNLELAFEGDAKLKVAFSNNDFEPLELIGGSGERYEKLEFYYVF